MFRLLRRLNAKLTMFLDKGTIYIYIYVGCVTDVSGLLSVSFFGAMWLQWQQFAEVETILFSVHFEGHPERRNYTLHQYGAVT
jgi:hypothetical protein